MAAERADIHMLVECQPDGAPAPVDVILVGRHPETHRESVLIVELKQWSSVEPSTRQPGRVDVPGMAGPKRHPSDQLRKNFDFYTGESGPLHGMTVEYAGLTYLHNAADQDVRPLLDIDLPTGRHALYFTSDTREDMREEIRERFSDSSGVSAAEQVLQRIGIRNTPLLDAMARSHGEDTVFTLRGAQRTVWREVTKAVKRTHRDGGQAVFVVLGGAGTGKSAIGLELLEEFTRSGKQVKYASGSRAFDAAMRQHVGYGDTEFQDRFAFFNSFVKSPEPQLDLLICDEAHRLRERSTSRYWKPENQGVQPQVDELIDAARVTVFLLDENQVVRHDEVGTREMIETAVRKRPGIPLGRYELREEFRCGGSDSYRMWVHDLLGISGDEPRQWMPDGLMHVEVADSPEEMERIILSEAQAGASARMVAGFSWPWSDPRKDRSLVPDVHIGDWHRPWNAKGDRSSYADGAPPAKLWGVREAGVHQVGCVYSAQGLEWDWCGVILGDDMVWRDGSWEFRRGKFKKDEATGIWQTLQPGSADRRITATSNDRFDDCVRNAYHVLLTRASRATVLYSTDKRTQDHLKEQVGPVEILGLRPTWVNLSPEAKLTRPGTPAGARGRAVKRWRKSRRAQIEGGQLDLFIP